MERVSVVGSAGTSYRSVDVPRTLLNVGAVIAAVICISATMLRVFKGGPILPGLVYGSVAAIETGWLVGQAILVNRQD